MILKRECRKAVGYIKDLCEKESVPKYREALCAVLLRETNMYLNNNVSGYFIEDSLFMKMLFGKEAASYEKIIIKMCDSVKNAQIIDKERAFLKAKSFIEENIQSPQLYAAAVSEHIGICPGQLTKLFERETGMTPSEYISALRVSKSIPLLSCGEKSVSEIAQISGFSSVETYIRAFKKNYATTPGKYMREME